jgi:putative flippase GtrA
VGAGNTAVDFTVFFILSMAGMLYLPAQALSYTAGVVNSYFVNRIWTFRVANKVSFPEAASFLTVNCLSLLAASGFLHILYDANHLNLWFSKCIATGAGVIVNYTGSRLWVFAENRKARSEVL